MKVYVLEESAALLSASLSLCLVGEPDPKAAQLPLRILHRAVSRGWFVRSLGGARKAERERERPSVTCRTVGLAAAAALAARLLLPVATDGRLSR